MQQSVRYRVLNKNIRDDYVLNSSACQVFLIDRSNETKPS